MSKILAFGLWVMLCLACEVVCAQSLDSTADKAVRLPSKWLGHVIDKTSSLDHQVTKQTSSYLTKLMKKEQRMKQRLARIDSAGAKQLFAGSEQQYAALLKKIQVDTGSKRISVSGEYQPYLDSLQGTLGFLKQNPRLGQGLGAAEIQRALSQLQQLQAKIKDADQVRALVEARKQQISQYIAAHANAAGILGKPFSGMKQEAYYYSQRVHDYKAMLNDPDRLEREALVQLRRLPAFQTFMKNNSQLAGLFGMPAGGGGAGAAAIAGLQTKDQVTQQVIGQVSAMGQGGMDNLQSSVSGAQSQLDGYKNKLGQLGAGNTSADVPDFRPNDQKTKTFWRRLEYGVNFQTTHNNYYFPIVTDLGGSLGYKLGHNNVVGVGGSYKMGWGSGIQHIALSSQGVGLRSFVEIGLKGSFSAAGGFEYNYTTPFASFQQLKQLQYWTKSGLVGVSKTVSIKSRLLKKTKVQLLWDFLSYQQVPKTQAILFRLGYNF